MQETSLSKDESVARIDVTDEKPSSRYGFSPDDRAFFSLCSAVRQCGEAARHNQSRIHRTLKYDGSILTETDLAVSDALISVIRNLYPDCNIVTEETDLHDFRDGARYTFVLDPIDGTDAYSQGLPSWCVALGILDSERKPCGGIIYAPRFGVGEQDLFLCAVPGDGNLYLNGEIHRTPEHYDVPKQMIIGSDTLRYVNLGNYRGKIRTFGSSIIHMTAPAVFSNLDCAINTYCYAWDVAAADAVARRAGLRLCYFDGREIEYDDSLLIERNKVRMPMLVGSERCTKWMMENLLLVK